MCSVPKSVRLQRNSFQDARRWIYRLFAVLLMLKFEQLAAESPRVVYIEPGNDVPAIVNGAPAGTSFVFLPGIYRMESIVPKDNDQFIGHGTVILNGSKILQMQPDGRYWSVREPRSPGGAWHCAEDHPLCWILNDLFIDDHLQVPVASLEELRAGKWFFDETSQKVYISTDPGGHKVEFGKVAAAFSGTAKEVRLSHLVIEKYASPPQQGAIGGSLTPVNQSERSTGKPQAWKIQDIEVRWNHGAGIEVGSRAQVDSCKIHHNGQLGIGGHGTNIVFTNNDVSYNNYAGYNTAFEAGGSKFAVSDNLIVRSNYFHDNFGNGLWTDTDNIHVLLEKNTISNNLGEGIRHEISYDAVIRNNLLTGNMSGIVISLSPRVEVYGNVIEVPANGVDGIVLANGQRGSGAYGPHICHDDSVHDNTITYLGQSGRSGLGGDTRSATNVRFDNNQYHGVNQGDTHWKWGIPMNFSDLQKTGVELHGKIFQSLPTPMDPTRAQ
jgi:parallel beta-helix repeat protein